MKACHVALVSYVLADIQKLICIRAHKIEILFILTAAITDHQVPIEGSLRSVVKRVLIFNHDKEPNDHERGKKKLTQCLSCLIGIDRTISFDVSLLLLEIWPDLLGVKFFEKELSSSSANIWW